MIAPEPLPEPPLRPDRIGPLQLLTVDQLVERAVAWARIDEETARRFRATLRLLGQTRCTGFSLEAVLERPPRPRAFVAAGCWTGGETAPAVWRFGAGADPLLAVLQLAGQVLDGALCLSCGRTSALEAEQIAPMPASNALCWVQYDPELRTFRRDCD